MIRKVEALRKQEANAGVSGVGFEIEALPTFRFNRCCRK